VALYDGTLSIQQVCAESIADIDGNGPTRFTNVEIINTTPVGIVLIKSVAPVTDNARNIGVEVNRREFPMGACLVPAHVAPRMVVLGPTNKVNVSVTHFTEVYMSISPCLNVCNSIASGRAAVSIPIGNKAQSLVLLVNVG